MEQNHIEEIQGGYVPFWLCDCQVDGSIHYHATNISTWREGDYCEAIPVDVLVCKGQKRTGGRSSNTRGTPNVISNGSVVAVADGQCMCIVENGKVVDVCAVPGEFVYDTSIAPSLFTGDLV